MSNLKIFHVSKPGPDSRGPDGPSQSHSADYSEHPNKGHDKTYAHDNTPARLREFESQGHQARAQADGYSDDHTNYSHSLLSHTVKVDVGAGRSSIGVDARASEFGLNANVGPGNVGRHGAGNQPEAGQPEGSLNFRGSVNLQEGDGEGHSHGRGSFHANAHGRTENFFDSPGKGRSPVNFQIDTRASSNGRGAEARGNDARGRTEEFSGSQSKGRFPVNAEADIGVSSNGRGREAHGNNARGRTEEFFDAQSKGRSPVNFEREVSSSNHGRHDLRDNSEAGNQGWWRRSGDRDLLSGTVNSVRRTLGETVRVVSDQLRAVERNARGSGHERLDHTFNYADRLISRTNASLETRLGQGGQPDKVARQIISEVVSLSELDRYFSLLEKTGGEPVRQAYRAVMEFLLGQGVFDESDRLQFASELLRDLQSGLFLYQEDVDGPFPLTGRPRVVSEMIALMRTLDAIDALAQMRQRGQSDLGLSPLLSGSGIAGSELTEVLEQLLAGSRTMLPGLAGRLEIPRLAAALGGLLNDVDGHPLLTLDGKPLKAGELLWLNTLGSDASWVGDKFPSRFSPPLVYGFDAIYSLIGFDGRALSLPRFLAIQSEINGFEFEWVLGQTPLSEAWIRCAIELLKDSRVLAHNVLGELLEEAWTAGRFHMVVMRGTVEEGTPVSGSFSFSKAYSFNPIRAAAG